MGKQSARLYYDGKDHKEIYFQGNYHMAMYKGGHLVWKKITEGKHIPYIFKEGNNLVLKVLYVKGRTTVTVGNSKKFVSSRDTLVRGEKIVGFVVTNGTIVFSKDGKIFETIPLEIENEFEYEENYTKEFSTYSAQNDDFFWFARIYKHDGSGIRDYVTVITNTKNSMSNGVGVYIENNYAGGKIISGIINPNIGKFIARFYFFDGTKQWETACLYSLTKSNIINYSFIFSSGGTAADSTYYILGSDSQYLYAYAKILYMHTVYERRFEKIALSDNKSTSTKLYNDDLEKNYYQYIKSSLYKNGKFIVYCSVNGKLEIYTTNDFLEFTKIRTNKSISIHDISSGKNIILSFDSEISGDWYMQPYCNLDNTYYFDENGDMQDDTGCLFCATKENVEVGITPRRAMFYFDNFYFRESEGNFCEISD